MERCGHGCALGEKVLLIDADVGLRSLDMVLGMTDSLLFSYGDVIRGTATLKEAAVPHPQAGGLRVLTAPGEPTEEGSFSREEIGALLDRAREHFTYILVDCAAGLGKDVISFAVEADRVVLVSTSDYTALRSANRTAGLLNEEGTCAIVDARLGRVIGNISFKPPHPHLAQDERLKPHRGGCLSFALSAQRRREGLAQEAAEAVMCHQFLTERVDYINCGFFSFNEPSRRLQERLGFHFFSTHRFRLGKEEIEVIENILWREEYLALVSGNDGSKNFDERAVTP